MPLIKSHSNYVLKSKHQTINDGTIWERDITTIGGLNQFAPGQTPIYKSGNFIITVRDDRRVTNQYNTKKWEKGVSGDVWTLETIKDMVSNKDNDNDTKIVLKRDYYDFRDFAYYGSLTELFRSSVTDIFERFPGELYFSGEYVYYDKTYTVDGQLVTETKILGSGVTEDGFVYELKNPFGIDIHSKKLPPYANPLRFFADGGKDNFRLLSPSGACDNSSGCTYEIEIPEICSGCTNPGESMHDCCGCNDFSGITLDPPDCDGCDGIDNVSVEPSNSRSRSRRNATDCDFEKPIQIRLFLDNLGNIHYMYKDEKLHGYHLRPDNKFLIEFYNNSNDFEKLILDFDTTPRYKSTFSVINENEYGYYRTFEDFVFPTSEGGYNPTTDSSFIDNLLRIGDFYDERFTDNLYRSMTHEAIKNFDWTYTREYEEGDELQFVAGGKKIQKALRIFAREFDEIKSYIDNIRFMNRVTYDERSNMPDYFLSDKCEESGWDVKYVMPYDLKLISGDTEVISGSVEDLLLNNSKSEYAQISKDTVTPYSKIHIKDGSENGYFIDCSGSTDITDFDCWLRSWYGDKDCKLKIRKALPIETNIDPDSCVVSYESMAIMDRKDGTSRITNRIKSYTDETEYSYMGINNEFLRRLSLNSKAIWNHKGTIEGIEMILGMFGLKSKRWLDKNESLRYSITQLSGQCDNNPPSTSCSTAPDYDIKEYTSFANRIEEEWDVEHQMYRIDWVNTTKTIVYDNRSLSNYTLPGGVGMTRTPYQGILVSYRDEYVGYSDADRYMTYGDNQYYLDVNGNKIPKRYLYPSFNKNEQLDGNPYFQMDGGWLSKKLDGVSGNGLNFQFDVDDNIVYNEYISAGTVSEDGVITDNHPLFKETIRSIKTVETLNDLITIPQNQLHDGSICYVEKVGSDIAIIDGKIFDITYEKSGSTLLKYVTYERKGGFVSIGDKYFDEGMNVYNKYGEVDTYSLDDKLDGYEIKAYIKSDEDFITYSTENSAYTISSFSIISGDDESYSNYYILNDTVYSNNISTSGNTEGWRRLKYTDYDYLRINTITNYYGGNNGHNGNMVYDNGHEYFTYFNRIFKYAFDNDMFDVRCYTDGFDWFGGEVFDYGFSGLIDSNEEIKQYDTYLLEDNKIHYFGNYKRAKYRIVDDDGRPIDDNWISENESSYTEVKISSKENSGTVESDIEFVKIYGDPKRYGSGQTEFEDVWKKIYGQETVISSDSAVTAIDTYGDDVLSGMGVDVNSVDDITNQIVNNKRFKLTFNMKYKFDTKNGQCELKYIDDIVMNYLTQLVPSTTIIDIEYNYKDAKG